MKRIALAAALAAAACGAKRTTAASQPSPAAFDASKSDPKAIATVDAAIAALGGYDKWSSIKELRFELKYNADGKVQGWFKHKWDRWNGRHDFAMADAATIASPDPTKVAWLEVHYDMFDADRIPWGTYQGQPLAEPDARKYAPIAKQHLAVDAYMMMLVYKLRDPGVHLASSDAKDLVGADDLCKPACDTVKVTFAPEVGKDTWLIDFNTESHLPQVIEKQINENGVAAYRIDGWLDAGGLKWPAKLSNIGVPAEFFEFAAVSVGEPADEDYIAPVDRSMSNATAAGKN